ncbi:MAG: FkbM family methyltransferase [Rhodospirillaceae bacterium]
MDMTQLEAANARALKAFQAGGLVTASAAQIPYYGFYDANIFECLPFVMFTANDCPRAANILYEREFEPGSMQIWCRLAKTASGILDIGAHVGVYSLAAASIRKDVKIHAFEPNPHAYTRLRMHIQVNEFRNIVEHWFAVSNKDGIAPFSWVRKPNQQISSGGGLGRGTGREEIIVPKHKLDGTQIASMIGDRALVKVDVEGGEILAFQGMSEVLARKPDILLETFNPAACDAINPLLSALGYKVYAVLERERKVVRQDKLYPCDSTSGNFNQFLTVRPEDHVAVLADISS